MTEPTVDLRDHRGRLIRLAVAVAIGAGLTFLTMRALAADSVQPNKDPVGGSTVALLAIAVFVVVTLVVHGAIAKLVRYWQRSTSNHTGQ